MDLFDISIFIREAWPLWSPGSYVSIMCWYLYFCWWNTESDATFAPKNITAINAYAKKTIFNPDMIIRRYSQKFHKNVSLVQYVSEYWKVYEILFSHQKKETLASEKNHHMIAYDSNQLVIYDSLKRRRAQKSKVCAKTLCYCVLGLSFNPILKLQLL